MRNREIALEFLKRFCAGDLASTAPLLADDLHFSGPGSLQNLGVLPAKDRDSAAGPLYNVFNVIEDDDDGVTVLYEYGAFQIAQWFRIQDGQIVETDLAVDAKADRQDWQTLLRQGVRCSLRPSRRTSTRPSLFQVPSHES